MKDFMVVLLECFRLVNSNRHFKHVLDPKYRDLDHGTRDLEVEVGSFSLDYSHAHKRSSVISRIDRNRRIRLTLLSSLSPSGTKLG